MIAYDAMVTGIIVISITFFITNYNLERKAWTSQLHYGRMKEDRFTSNGTLTPKSAPLMGP